MKRKKVKSATAWCKLTCGGYILVDRLRLMRHMADHIDGAGPVIRVRISPIQQRKVKRGKK